MVAYYNEHEPEAAAWLRELIKARLIPPGDVDERSIEDIQPNELAGYRQCHFFAGIGVWPYALRLAGWPDDRPCWTGSCPCQPFSSLGEGKGFADERHLWPSWFHLIAIREPAVVFGEQVASSDGLAWIDLVHSDMEAAGYAIASFDLCAAGFGAPHIRQRLYFVAYTDSNGCETRSEGSEAMGYRKAAWSGRGFGELGHAFRSRLEGHAGDGHDQARRPVAPRPITTAGITSGFWAGADLVYHRDNKWRPVEPGSFPLAHEPAAFMGRLRCYGNSIVAEQAATFIHAYMTT